MTSPLRGRRRPNLATIVGSGLAVVAAGSLLAFSSLAEQAGLQGLATGGLQPAAPGRSGGSRAITIAAPATAPPRESGTVDQIVRDVVDRVAAAPPTPVLGPVPTAEPERPSRPAREEKPKKDKKDHRNRPKRPSGPVVVARTTPPPAEPETEPETPGGPPYGKAHGHDKHDKPKKPKAPKPEKGSGKPDEQPVYARSTSDDDEPKAPKTKKLEKAKASPGQSKGKGNGHDKHDHDNGNGKSKGKGKGHDKHGH